MGDACVSSKEGIYVYVTFKLDMQDLAATSIPAGREAAAALTDPRSIEGGSSNQPSSPGGAADTAPALDEALGWLHVGDALAAALSARLPSTCTVLPGNVEVFLLPGGADAEGVARYDLAGSLQGGAGLGFGVGEGGAGGGGEEGGEPGRASQGGGALGLGLPGGVSLTDDGKLMQARASVHVLEPSVTETGSPRVDSCIAAVAFSAAPSGLTPAVARELASRSGEKAAVAGLSKRVRILEASSVEVRSAPSGYRRIEKNDLGVAAPAAGAVSAPAQDKAESSTYYSSPNTAFGTSPFAVFAVQMAGIAALILMLLLARRWRAISRGGGLAAALRRPRGVGERGGAYPFGEDEERGRHSRGGGRIKDDEFVLRGVGGEKLRTN